MIERVGIYSGTFDPVHKGHVIFCLEAIKACKLDRVLILPEEHPRHKATITSIEHRVAMLELATGAWPQLEVIRLRSGRFTVRDTLPEIYSYVHGAELTMLLGSDVAKHMTSWPNIGDLLAKVSLAIGLRGTDSINDVSRIVQLLELGKPVPIQYVVTPHIHAASSRSRKQLTKDRDLDPVVVAYALQNALYTSPA